MARKCEIVEPHPEPAPLTWKAIAAITGAFGLVGAVSTAVIVWPPPWRLVVVAGVVWILFGFLWVFKWRNAEARLRYLLVLALILAATALLARPFLGISGHVNLRWEVLNIDVALDDSPATDIVRLLGGVLLFALAVWFLKHRPAVIQFEEQIAPAVESEQQAATPTPPAPEVFWRRVQSLFENRGHARITLSYDVATGILAGRSRDAFGAETKVVVRVDDRRLPLTAADVAPFLHNCESGGHSFYVVPDRALVSPSVANPHPSLVFETEADLLDQLVDFKPYL